MLVSKLLVLLEFEFEISMGVRYQGSDPGFAQVCGEDACFVQDKGYEFLNILVNDEVYIGGAGFDFGFVW